MHKRILNELRLTIDIVPNDSPLLIKSGRESGADPTLLDMNFVRAIHPTTGKRTVFLPGSSLKGTVRSYVERIARSVKPDVGTKWCCNPFANNSDACGGLLEKERDPARRYARACSACRTFGHTRLGSHLFTSDAYPVDDPVLEQRDGVAIDRITGAVAAGPFNLEVVSQGTFRTVLTMRNFQLWQIGVLAVALRDLSDGLVPIGFGKSKGFGRVRLTYFDAHISYPGQWQAQYDDKDFSANLYDLQAFSFEKKHTYSLAPVLKENAKEVEGVPLSATLVEPGDYGRVTVLLSDDSSIRKLLLSTVRYWKHAVDTWPWNE